MAKRITSEQFILFAKSLIASQYLDGIKADDIYVVWYSKTLQNHKALLSHPKHGFPYIEVTFDGDKGVFYVDQYKKACQNNFCLDESGNLIEIEIPPYAGD